MIVVPAEDPRFPAVQAAANGEAQPQAVEEARQNAPETVETTQEAQEEAPEAVEPAPESTAEPQPVSQQQGAQDETPPETVETAQEAVRSSREKTFVGTQFCGECFHIHFNAETQRTEVFIRPNAPKAAHTAAQEAGFYYSSATGTYNKKLTFKAYRAAHALAEKLCTLSCVA